MLKSVLFSTSLVFVGATSAVAQPKNHIGQPLAEIMIENGCIMPEEEAAAALKAKGYGISDLQAQATALYNGRYLGSTPDNKWRLQNWDPCH
ncbi:MAG: hypothetical protein HKN30_14820 [Sulfitobacter sp.]|nr:hypothetical protein [Sulfitobacter sp.]